MPLLSNIYLTETVIFEADFNNVDLSYANDKESYKATKIVDLAHLL